MYLRGGGVQMSDFIVLGNCIKLCLKLYISNHNALIVGRLVPEYYVYKGMLSYLHFLVCLWTYTRLLKKRER